MQSQRARTGTELLIVDNSDTEWKVSSYLRQWADLSKQFDIATGYFEIGGLLAIDGAWQKVEDIRILMGDTSGNRTRKTLNDALMVHSKRLDENIEAVKRTNHFLEGVPGIVDGIASGQIKVRIYRKRRFHAKAYITHATQAVIGSFGLVGSSNLTNPGLNDNIELNVQLTGTQVPPLQAWYDELWNDAEDVTEQMLEAIKRHTREYSPFEVYARALQEFFRGHELTASEWERADSKMYSRLDRYQQEGYQATLKIARQHGGAFLCDGVGLGKTFVGLMLIERMILLESKRVLLLAPKTALEGVWKPHIDEYLPHIGSQDTFSNLKLMAHTDINAKSQRETFERAAKLADVVIIDEAHHFRNQGGPETRYGILYNLLGEAAAGRKQIYMLTATPINNRLADFRHLAELFTRKDDAYFAETLGVSNLKAYFVQMEKDLKRRLNVPEADGLGERLNQVDEFLRTESFFQALVVQRSRAYVRESQLQEGKDETLFPQRRPPQVANYSMKKAYGQLLTFFQAAFDKDDPLFKLPVYNPEPYWIGPDREEDSALAFKKERGKQNVVLIRTNFLKRFESSIYAFTRSCDRLLAKLEAYTNLNAQTPEEHERLIAWKTANKRVLEDARSRQLEWSDPEPEKMDEDADVLLSDDLVQAEEKLNRQHYDVPRILDDLFQDMDNVLQLLRLAVETKTQKDDKVRKLIDMLNTKELSEEKVLIFTEFADTALYLQRELNEAAITGVECITGGQVGRADYIQRFAPYYNRSNSAAQGAREIRVLISTDVLSEGLNLQDATKLINYDIHWNPVRLMQRIGRVDRRMNQDIEAAIAKQHPERVRGVVEYWNFLPPEELKDILSLYTRVANKVLMISSTLGIEGRQLLTPTDEYHDLRVLGDFESVLQGTKSVEESMHLELEELLRANPELGVQLAGLPNGTFSGKNRPDSAHAGVFFCYALPALDREKGEYTLDAGTTKWYFREAESARILTEPADIIESIRSVRATPRRTVMQTNTLSDIRNEVEKHIKNSYLKRVDAPLGVDAELRCWMEVS
jgi:superfamily II DNA or RNA helicase